MPPLARGWPRKWVSAARPSDLSSVTSGRLCRSGLNPEGRPLGRPSRFVRHLQAVSGPPPRRHRLPADWVSFRRLRQRQRPQALQGGPDSHSNCAAGVHPTRVRPAAPLVRGQRFQSSPPTSPSRSRRKPMHPSIGDGWNRWTSALESTKLFLFCSLNHGLFYKHVWRLERECGRGKCGESKAGGTACGRQAGPHAATSQGLRGGKPWQRALPR